MILHIITAMSLRWKFTALKSKARIPRSNWYEKFKFKGAKSLFWIFYLKWKTNPNKLIEDYAKGNYNPEPMQKFHFKDETILVWSFQDRLIQKLLLLQIKSTFKHVISNSCYHLMGPSGVKPALRKIRQALESGKFKYVIRADVKGYYASVQHDILIQQLLKIYKDPRLQKYLPAIVSPLIDDNANLTQPTQGLPRRSTLSSFFAAVYLTPLDRAFEKTENVVYVRFMDDIVILAKTKRQFEKAKKNLKTHFKKLKLTLSPHKTKMGEIKNGFHMLGAKFPEAQTSGIPPDDQKPPPQTDKKVNQPARELAEDHLKNQVAIQLHNRTYCRALDQVIAMIDDAVNPAIIQQYLKR